MVDQNVAVLDHQFSCSLVSQVPEALVFVKLSQMDASGFRGRRYENLLTGARSKFTEFLYRGAGGFALKGTAVDFFRHRQNEFQCWRELLESWRLVDFPVENGPGNKAIGSIREGADYLIVVR
jgi:hypothetical protein